MKRHYCTTIKTAMYTFMGVVALSVCTSDKSAIAKVALCAGFAFTGFLWDCLLDCMACENHKSQHENKRAA